MELTPSQKQSGFETWLHIWHLQRFVLSCQKSLLLQEDSAKQTLVTLLVDCVRSYNPFHGAARQSRSFIEEHPVSDVNDLCIMEQVYTNTFELLLDLSKEAPDTYNLFDSRSLMSQMAIILANRCVSHDQSKFSITEVELFDKYTPKLKITKFGSPEYQEFLVGLKPALDHHYKNNRHHPEHYPQGISGMTLIDLIEMCCDWAASGLRTKDGTFEHSQSITQPRFGYGKYLHYILDNTYQAYIHPIKDLTGDDYKFQVPV